MGTPDIPNTPIAPEPITRHLAYYTLEETRYLPVAWGISSNYREACVIALRNLGRYLEDHGLIVKLLESDASVQNLIINKKTYRVAHRVYRG